MGNNTKRFESSWSIGSGVANAFTWAMYSNVSSDRPVDDMLEIKFDLCEIFLITLCVRICNITRASHARTNNVVRILHEYKISCFCALCCVNTRTMTAIYPEGQQIMYWILSSMVVFITIYVIDLRLYHRWRPVWGAPGWVMMLLWAIGLFVASGAAWVTQDQSATPIDLPSGWVYTLTVYVILLVMLFIWPFSTAASNSYERLWLAWTSAGWMLISFGLSVWVMVKTTVSYSTTGGWLFFPLELILLYFTSVSFGSAYRMSYYEPRELTDDGIDELEFNFADRQDGARRTERRERERRNANQEYDRSQGRRRRRRRDGGGYASPSNSERKERQNRRDRNRRRQNGNDSSIVF